MVSIGIGCGSPAMELKVPESLLLLLPVSPRHHLQLPTWSDLTGAAGLTPRKHLRIDWHWHSGYSGLAFRASVEIYTCIYVDVCKAITYITTT